MKHGEPVKAEEHGSPPFVHYLTSFLFQTGPTHRGRYGETRSDPSEVHARQAKRYLSHVRASPASSLCLAWMLICRGCLASTMPASCGVRSPFLLLQPKQQATRFSHVERPRRERGTTWSSVRLPAGSLAPQYWRRLPSRSRIPLRGDGPVLPRHPPVLHQAHHARHGNADLRSPDGVGGNLLDHSRALKHERQRTARADDVDRFVAGVDHEAQAVQGHKNPGEAGGS
jgi:hypothetical protein